MSAKPKNLEAWRWIPTLYFAEGIPYVAVMTLSVVMYKNLEVSNTAIALYTSWLYVPWVIKPLWSPIVDLFRTKRLWIVAMQLIIGGGFAAVALTVPTTHFFQLTLAMFWLVAFSSATHDIAADGFYMLAMSSHDQAAFVGIRSTFYRLATLSGQGGLVLLAGWLQGRTGSFAHAWSLVFFVTTALFVVVGLYHAFALPRPAADHAGRGDRKLLADFFGVFVEFFRRPGIGVILAFLLLYRFAEAQLLKLVVPFLLDKRVAGGLELSNEQVGIVYGTIGVIALTVGGLVGGWMISRFGLKRMLWPMIITMHLPNLAFVALALAQPHALAVISAALAVEQFAYGFGFTAYMLFMIMVAEGEHRTAHYAICTGIMALGMMVPAMPAGWLQDHLGYVRFFIYVCLATMPPFTAAYFVKIDPEFGRKG